MRNVSVSRLARFGVRKRVFGGDLRNVGGLSCSDAGRKLSGLIRTDDPWSLRRIQQKDTAELLSPSPSPLGEAEPSGVSKADPADVIDLSSMYDPSIHLPDKPDFASLSSKYEAATPLSDALVAQIGVTGPITVAEYMRQALRHPTFGYYTRQRAAARNNSNNDNNNNDDDDWDRVDDEPAGIIGADGDFITAPEISQVFGESILIWLVHLWEVHLSKSAVRIVELGPGRGTLMADIAAAAMRAFPAFASAIAHIHLVEVSRPLRQEQREALQAVVDRLEPSPAFCFAFDPPDQQPPAAHATPHAIPVSWHDHLSSVPVHHDGPGSPLPTLFIGQEVLDALPIHSFQRTAKGEWRERLVDVAATSQPADDADTDQHQKEPSHGATSRARSRYVETAVDPPMDKRISHKQPRLRFVIPPDTTPALRTLLNVDKQGRLLPSVVAADEEAEAAEGDVIEVCPEGMVMVQDVASRIDECGGAALFIDYGYNGGGGDTLRAFHKHNQVHVLSSPGMVDVTADVDFYALGQAVNSGMDKIRTLRQQQPSTTNPDNQSAKDHIKATNSATTTNNKKAMAFGPITQGEFMAAMGATERVIREIEDPATTDEQAEALVAALERLMSHESPHMGARYKVLAICPKKDGIFAPPGFSSKAQQPDPK